jgi:hypothetical protein
MVIILAGNGLIPGSQPYFACAGIAIDFIGNFSPIPLDPSALILHSHRQRIPGSKGTVSF